jgi:hypothetical protein
MIDECGRLAMNACDSHLFNLSKSPYLIEGVDGGGEATVHAEDFVVDDGRETQVVEDLGAVPPHIDGPVLLKALVVEAVHLRDLSRLVVSTDQSDPVRIPNLYVGKDVAI